MHKDFDQLGFQQGDIVLCTGTRSREYNAFIGKIFRLDYMFNYDTLALLIDGNDCHGFVGTDCSWTIAKPWVQATKPLHRVSQSLDGKLHPVPVVAPEPDTAPQS